MNVLRLHRTFSDHFSIRLSASDSGTEIPMLVGRISSGKSAHLHVRARVAGAPVKAWRREANSRAQSLNCTSAIQENSADLDRASND